MGVSENGGTPQSSNLIGISIINHPFWGTPIFGNAHIAIKRHISVEGVHSLTTRNQNNGRNHETSYIIPADWASMEGSQCLDGNDHIDHAFS